MREETRKDAERLAKDITHFVNSFSSKEETEFLANEMCKQHRTLQQSFANFVFQYIKKQAVMYDTNYYDARNEASVKIFKELSKILEKTGIILPYI